MKLISLSGLLFLALSVGCSRLDKKNLFPDSSVEDLSIRGHRWNVILNKPTDTAMDTIGADGLTECENRLIFIHEGLKYSSQRDVVLHEIFHAGTCTSDGAVDDSFWNSEDPETHEGIYRIGEFLADMLHENPDLTLYLAGER